MSDIIESLRAAISEQDAAKVLHIANEVVQQYDEGLIKVLPCKVGDTVWINALVPCADCPNGAKPANVCLKSECPQRPTPVSFSVSMYDNTYKAGSSTVSNRVKQAILFYAAWFFMHPDTEKVPDAFYSLLKKGRVVPV